MKQKGSELLMNLANVAPFVGAWIETVTEVKYVCSNGKSLPSWERGLKRGRKAQDTWEVGVAPFVGAWIETLNAGTKSYTNSSLPSWERGLKQHLCDPRQQCTIRRSLRGSVD